MISKSRTGAQVEDWITPSHVEIIRVKPPVERLEWLARRAEELKAAMGSRYLCHEKNRVGVWTVAHIRRIKGRVQCAAPETVGINTG